MIKEFKKLDKLVNDLKFYIRLKYETKKEIKDYENRYNNNEIIENYETIIYEYNLIVENCKNKIVEYKDAIMKFEL